MNKSIYSICLVTLGLYSTMSWAGATRTEAKAFCDKAASHEEKVGKQKALADWKAPGSKTNGWFTDDLYVFSIDGDYNIISHGANAKLIGKNVKKMKGQAQADGTPASYFMQEMMKLSKTGKKGADFSYNFMTPKTKQNRKKVSFVYPYSDGSAGYFGCGYYE
ncbi:MAG: cytochrome c [Phenylobacterium sp.]|jgi:cytochrome c